MARPTRSTAPSSQAAASARLEGQEVTVPNSPGAVGRKPSPESCIFSAGTPSRGIALTTPTKLPTTLKPWPCSSPVSSSAVRFASSSSALRVAWSQGSGSMASASTLAPDDGVGSGLVVAAGLGAAAYRPVNWNRCCPLVPGLATEEQTAPMRQPASSAAATAARPSRLPRQGPSCSTATPSSTSQAWQGALGMQTRGSVS
mmetsp:Transcript_32226/g.92753  ORF Transcript_32226/g.92753 Transcript_32226/m.92753 type:complete len:201 (+) Transcript_32226:1882-2484(+)